MKKKIKIWCDQHIGAWVDCAHNPNQYERRLSFYKYVMELLNRK